MPDAPHKGLALERERAHFACDTVIYVGDDETDEDVFRLDRPGQLLVESGSDGTERRWRADYIRNQAGIDKFLTDVSRALSELAVVSERVRSTASSTGKS